MSSQVYVTRFASWAPGINTPAEWDAWAQGKKEIAATNDAPPLDFADSQWLQLPPKEFALFKRRQSQLSRMTIQVLHDIMPIGENVKTTFVSFRGEIAQQFKINKMLITEGDLSPAAFSQSVFNTPIALAAIALGLKQGYSAIYPRGGDFATGFKVAAAPLFAGETSEVALVYADELVPAEYNAPLPTKPLAFACLLTVNAADIAIAPDGEHLSSPEAFLKFLYDNRGAL